MGDNLQFSIMKCELAYYITLLPVDFIIYRPCDVFYEILFSVNKLYAVFLNTVTVQVYKTIRIFV